MRFKLKDNINILIYFITEKSYVFCKNYPVYQMQKNKEYLALMQK